MLRHEHNFDDCKCCGEPAICGICGNTSRELELMEEIGRLKEELAEIQWRMEGLEK